MHVEERKLSDLHGIGKAMLADFELLGIKSVQQLAQRDPDKLYQELERRRGQKMDVCCLDTFRCAVAQAKDPKLPREKCDWWYWSRQRKSTKA